MVKILSPLPIFSSTVLSLLIKGALSSAVYVALTVNRWIVPIMISQKRYFLATHPKFRAMTSKSLMHRLIRSSRVRYLTNHFFFNHSSLISKSELNQQFLYILYIYYIYYIYIYILLLLVSIIIIRFVLWIAS